MNIHYLIIGIALLLAIVALVRPANWPLPVAVLLVCIELFSHVSKLIMLASILLTLTACSRFVTKQTDTSYNENGLPLRSITTQASANTVLDSKSALSKFRASQTDKTQSATVGGLEQESSSEGLMKLMNMAFEMGKRSVVPVPTPAP